MNYRYLIIVLIVSLSYGATVDTVSIKSSKMDVSFQAIVILPDTRQEVALPVLYLLHGWSGNYRNWYEKTDIVSLSDKYKMIIVCPDGGYAGWYLDSPLDKDSQYESYIASDVVNYIDRTYPTIDQSDYRFLCGLSMGGHGAISLLSRHPDLFAAAGSMSGVMELSSSKNQYRISKLIGAFEGNPERWEQYSCLELVNNLVGLNKGILIDCGLADKFIQSNRQIHQKLIDLDIAHDYIERPGGHTWSYWTNALEYHLLFFKKWLNKSAN